MGLFDRLFKPTGEKLEKKKDLQVLIQELGSEKDMTIRQTAAKALGESGDPRAVDPLIAPSRMKII